ncbi:hypothetical protein CWQ_02380 [Buchnera aphidicola str. TLW03 (Acyrthosiphon pisum)]|nr:hypothetical protein CWQ_02380 [Buchnera aphidicola str. TLW03 (Acyrthosiphon pisum)]ADP67920.1 hypothetical protein CWU_02900 [Buchnera aphidicola str. JF98 (Acyrthosiphon pisum)]
MKNIYPNELKKSLMQKLHYFYIFFRRRFFFIRKKSRYDIEFCI